MATRALDHIDTIVIHCAATPLGSDRYTILDIDEWHAQRGFRRDELVRATYRPHLKAVGYHRIISVDGAVARGRSAGEVGAHAKGENRVSLGVCLMGTDNFTLPQWYALWDEVRSFQQVYPITRIIGHRDTPGGSHKICPGFDVKSWIDSNMEPLEGHIHGGWKQ